MNQPDQSDTPTHEECARLARQHWEDEKDPQRKAFLAKMAQMWAELAAVKKLEKQLDASETNEDDRLVG